MSDSGSDGVVRPGTRGVPRLHVVTDDRVLGRPDLLDRAEAILGITDDVALHLRGHGTDAVVLHGIASELRRRAAGSPGTLVVNDRVDVALAVGADAVQLGGRSLHPDDLPAASRLGTELRTGVSVHGPEEARARTGSRVDWLLLGTVFPTSSHPGRPAGGHALVSAVAADATLPVVAIGGVTPDRVQGVLGAGAHGVAVLGGVWAAPDPVAAVHRYLSAIASDANTDGERVP